MERRPTMKIVLKILALAGLVILLQSGLVFLLDRSRIESERATWEREKSALEDQLLIAQRERDLALDGLPRISSLRAVATPSPQRCFRSSE